MRFIRSNIFPGRKRGIQAFLFSHADCKRIAPHEFLCINATTPNFEWRIQFQICFSACFLGKRIFLIMNASFSRKIEIVITLVQGNMASISRVDDRGWISARSNVNWFTSSTVYKVMILAFFSALFFRLIIWDDWWTPSRHLTENKRVLMGADYLSFITNIKADKGNQFRDHLHHYIVFRKPSIRGSLHCWTRQHQNPRVSRGFNLNMN